MTQMPHQDLVVVDSNASIEDAAAEIMQALKDEGRLPPETKVFACKVEAGQLWIMFTDFSVVRIDSITPTTAG